MALLERVMSAMAELPLRGIGFPATRLLAHRRANRPFPLLREMYRMKFDWETSRPPNLREATHPNAHSRDH